MKTKFTPGPWSFEARDRNDGERMHHVILDDKGREIVDTLNSHWTLRDYVYLYEEEGTLWDDITGEANARLIAAAPDMLQALVLAEGAAADNATNEDRTKASTAIRNAIDKATT